MINRAKLSSFLLAAGISVILFGCQKITDTYPITPAITFKSYTIQKDLDSAGNPDYKLKLTVSFTDGDGDIGLAQSDTTGPFAPDMPYYYNFIVGYYEYVNGHFVHVTTNYPFPGDTINYNGRLPVITPSGKNKAIKGDIDYSIDLGSGSKTGNDIKFDFILYDRALHKSNLAESPDIALP